MCLTSVVCIMVKLAKAAHHLYSHLAMHLNNTLMYRKEIKNYSLLIVRARLAECVLRDGSIGCHEPLVMWILDTGAHALPTVYAQAVLLHTNILNIGKNNTQNPVLYTFTCCKDALAVINLALASWDSSSLAFNIFMLSFSSLTLVIIRLLFREYILIVTSDFNLA